MDETAVVESEGMVSLVYSEEEEEDEEEEGSEVEEEMVSLDMCVCSEKTLSIKVTSLRRSLDSAPY